jgi:hypothetical protein
MNLDARKGRGECRVPDAPAASCAEVVGSVRTSIHSESPEQPGIPARNGFTAYNALSPVTSSFCHRRLRIKVCPSPVGPTRLRRLDTSNGCQDHTLSPYASAPFVLRAGNHSRRAIRPAIPIARRRCRVHRIPPRVRDDRDTPLSVGRDGGRYSADLGLRKTRIFFRRGARQENRHGARRANQLGWRGRSSAASCSSTDASASAAPSLRSAGCALSSPRTAGRLLPACGRCSC